MHDTSELDQLILSQEQQLISPETRKSARALGLLLAPEFIEFTSSGEIANKEQTITALLEEPATSWEVTSFTITHLAPTVILLTYEATRTMAATHAKISSLRSSIWKRSDEWWQMVFHQGTTLSRP